MRCIAMDANVKENELVRMVTEELHEQFYPDSVPDALYHGLN